MSWNAYNAVQLVPEHRNVALVGVVFEDNASGLSWIGFVGCKICLKSQAINLSEVGTANLS